MSNEHKHAHPGRSDRQYINLSEDYEIRDWTKHFNISADELRHAVKSAGSSKASDVQEWLDKNKK